MPDEEKANTPEHIFKRVIWRSVIAIGGSMEQFTTWTLTGIAAIMAFFIGHLESVSTIVSSGGLKWCLMLFAFSVFAGVISKQIGMAVTHGVKTVTEMEAFLHSVDGQRLMADMTVDSHQLAKDIAAPFMWPLSYLMRRSGENGIQGDSSADQRFIRLFCLQLYTNLLHGLLAAAAVATLALSIK